MAQTADGTVHTDAGGRHLAPHDTFYTLEYVSARTPDGVEGFPPGTEVHLISVNREAHLLTVSDGRANVEVPPDKLTNDLDIADAVKVRDEAKQAQIAAYRQAQVAAYQKYQKEADAATAKDLEKRQQEIRDANTRAQAQTNADQNAQPVAASTTSSSKGYYNEGGYGYGSPYGYFVDQGTAENRRAQASTTATSDGGRGTISSQNSTSAGAVQTGGASRSGVAPTGGGKKP